MTQQPTPIRIFIAYSRKDNEYLIRIQAALNPLTRSGSIKLWHDGAIIPGEKWDDTIKKNLHEADIVLLLLSNDSLASDYFYDEEVTNALKRHHKGECTVVPIIVRDCLWEKTQLSDLQALPKDGKPIADWTSPDAAHKSIALGISILVENLQELAKKVANHLQSAQKYESQQKYPEAIAQLQAAIKLKPELQNEYSNKLQELAAKEAAAKRQAEEQAEKERQAREQAAKEAAAKRQAEEQAEKERQAREQAAKEAAAKRQAEEQAEKERQQREQAEKEAAAKRQAEKERQQREQAEKAEKERLEQEEQKTKNKRQFLELLQEADSLFTQKQYAQAHTAYQNLLNWKDKADIGYTDVQPYISHRLLLCKTETSREREQREQAEKERQQREQANKVAAAKRQAEKERQQREQAEKERQEREQANKVAAAKRQAEKERQQREQAEKAEKERLQKMGIGVGVLVLLLLTVWGVRGIVNRQPTTEPFAEQMVSIQGGTFTMGSPESEADRGDNEQQHKVTLSAFSMSKYEVTQAQWKAIMGNNPSYFSGYFSSCPQCPVEKVSWDDVQEFLTKLNAQTGKAYRLPTEAEWEYAARGGTNTPFNTGNCLSTDQANYDGNNPYQNCAKGQYREKTTPVGSFAPNQYGLYDMHGNVWEWCNDWYDENYYKNSPANNPTGPTTGTYRVLRGGSWNSGAQDCRVAYRGLYTPSDRFNDIGFRLALVP